MEVLMIVIIGAVILIGLYWQSKVLQHDRDNSFSIITFKDEILKDPKEAFDYWLPRRMWVPIIFGTVLLAGTIIWAIISIFFDSKSSIEPAIALENIFKISVLFILFNLKSYFGPVVFSFISCVAIYNVFQYGEISTIAILQPLIHWAFGYFPNWIEICYWIVLLLNSFGGSIMDVFD